jgi:hypothetical protein
MGELGDGTCVHLEKVLGSWVEIVDLGWPGACWRRQRCTRREQAGDGRSELVGSRLETLTLSKLVMVNVGCDDKRSFKVSLDDSSRRLALSLHTIGRHVYIYPAPNPSFPTCQH